MTIHVTTDGGKVLVFECGTHNAIDKMVAAIKENIDNWITIEIVISNN